MVWHDIDSFVVWLGLAREGYRLGSGVPMKVVCTSGGYSVLHVGHIKHLREAASLGDLLVVILNGDGFLQRKHGEVWETWERRADILSELRCVDHVVFWDDGSQFVDGAIRQIRPDVFARGGDRSRPEDVAERERRACAEVGCEVVYGVGGEDKPQSSSWLVQRLKDVVP